MRSDPTICQITAWLVNWERSRSYFYTLRTCPCITNDDRISWSEIAFEHFSLHLRKPHRTSQAKNYTNSCAIEKWSQDFLLFLTLVNVDSGVHVEADVGEDEVGAEAGVEAGHGPLGFKVADDLSPGLRVVLGTGSWKTDKIYKNSFQYIIKAWA